jgi:hypothetical protein
MLNRLRENFAGWLGLSSKESKSFLEKPTRSNVGFAGIILFCLLVAIYYILSVGNWIEPIPFTSPQAPLLLIEALVAAFITGFAFFLFFVSFLSYRRERSGALLLISSAAFLFAIKGALFAIHGVLEYGNLATPRFEATTIIFDFGILSILLIGLLRK